MSDVIVGVTVSLTLLNGEIHACPYQFVQLLGLHAVVHTVIVLLLNDHNGRIAAYSDEEISVIDLICVSFALQIAMVVNSHTLLAVR